MTTPTIRFQARLAGGLYLIPMFLGPFSMLFVPSRVLVAGDAAGTLLRLQAAAPLFRFGVAADLSIVFAELAITALLFAVFESVGPTLARTAAFARLAMAVLQAVNIFVHLAALGAAARGDAVQTLGLLELHAQAVHVWESAFALHCVLVGVLMLRSGFAPRALGSLLLLAGAGYGLNGLGALVAPGLAPVFATIVAITAVVGEVPFVFWLLLKGPARASAGSTPPARSLQDPGVRA
jgi:hypothetical protein